MRRNAAAKVADGDGSTVLNELEERRDRGLDPALVC